VYGLLKLKLYDSNDLIDEGILELTPFDSYKDRLEHINKNILRVERYVEYYNDKDRWLGIKLIGKPNKQENVKHTLDYLSGYLLYSKDFETRPLIIEYLELMKDDDRSKEEENRIKEIESLILYKRESNSCKISKNLIFILNQKYEEFIHNALGRHKKQEHKGYTEVYIEKKANEEINIISNIKNNIARLTKELKDKRDKIHNNKIVIGELYTDKTNAETIVKLSKQIKEFKKEIAYIINNIEELCSEYFFITHGRVYK
jgi:methyl-accepting chemotaxis protein